MFSMIRPFIQTSVRRASTFPSGSGESQSQRGGFRSGLLGFGLGAGVVGLGAYTSLVDHYRTSSDSLLSSVAALQTAVAKLQKHTAKIELVDRELKLLAQKSATISDVEALRTELLKITDGIAFEVLESKAKITELNNDVKGRK